ncbi:PREDICTED: uncharacterized protein LOC101290862 [Fragaria vesca subsp. vesca]|uniref:uncharacterized protein LOC101290862 n=1 Tax=Fragaria vesca subsp. vesca TaxID=101020 RepID=UPI0002C3539A|nr:PREDICTED: uncharacterized protein LOC101290862 [Fragaria vesca subsp. vesca]
MEAPTPATPHTPKSTDPSPQTPTESPLAASSARLWRPTAQRNLRNQWSKLASLRREWEAASSNGRANATSLVNAYLSIKYMGSRELGVLSDMPEIVKKASQKLHKQKELHRRKLLSSYKDMVSIVTNMVKTSRSMRCFVKGSSNSPLLQFSGYSEHNNDPGDGGGIPVFTFWSISCFEKVAEELVHMLMLELNVKRLLVVELLSVGSKVSPANILHWSEELYPEEFGDLSMCNLLSEETCEPVYPRLHGQKSDKPAIRRNQQPDHDVLQVYLTTWLVEVNIDSHRVDEIFAEVGEEIHCKLA